jgi:MerR family copper efflux transcriptional regulator
VVSSTRAASALPPASATARRAGFQSLQPSFLEVSVDEDVYAPRVPEGFLQIGEVAERVGLSLRTVRHYEEVGLFSPSGRSQGGFRLFSEADVERLRVLKGLKPTGLSLDEMRELMELINAGNEIGDQRALAEGLERYRDRADARIAELERHVAEVRQLRGEIAARLERVAVPRP